jgi:hypothetical protein
MRIKLASMLFGLWATAQPILAQEYVKQRVSGSGEHSTWMQWLIGTGFLIACLALGFKSSKRAELD